MAIQQGLAGSEQLDTVFPLGYNVPELRLRKWLRRLICSPSHLLNGRRIVNRFKLGADPEFIFTYQGARVNASGLNLKQGQAFGADNNGRLTEIRPYPSRSSLDVVASVLDTLRWMVILKPKTKDLAWESGAFLQDDGLGGHVHFGRKRPHRDQEITALDCIEELLLSLGAYPINDVIRRRRGDAHRQIYGALHDFRLQAHGYEYRTFPSWLDSPELAFMTITFAKLAVQNPLICQGMQVSTQAVLNLQKLKNLLAYYRDIDNDARLLLIMLNQGLFPQHIGGDFRGRWGIPVMVEVAKEHGVSVIPPAIKPRPETIKELTEHFAFGKPLGFSGKMTPTWMPYTIPPGYTMCINNVVTDQAKGFGELIWDLCVSKNFTINFTAGGGRDIEAPGRGGITVASNIAKLLPEGWQRTLHGVKIGKQRDNSIALAASTREGPQARLTKDILTSGAFPIWRAKDLQPDSYEQWAKHAKPASTKKPAASRSKLLYNTSPIPGMV